MLNLSEVLHKKLREGTLKLTQQEPKVQRNPLPNHKGKGVVVVVIHRSRANLEAEESKGSFHPNIVKTLQRNPKFRSLFNQLRFRPKARRITTKSLMSIGADIGVECFTVSRRSWPRRSNCPSASSPPPVPAGGPGCRPLCCAWPP